ncbi:ribonuclease H-like domain-containing protein [Tanacetum coccineum]|uniref:Ribonuclease H-like domain-containing protein n=1 Tax=Tanacetum coccineum TaxID=301880 RepID=A0ABQ5E5X0_9ASTR
MYYGLSILVLGNKAKNLDHSPRTNGASIVLLKDLTILMHKADPMDALVTFLTVKDPILQIMKKLMEDLFPLEVIAKEEKLLGKTLSLTCLFAKATPDESNLWYRRLGHRGSKHRVPSKENLIDLRVKVIRCNNETEFKNRVMNQLCEMKGIKREFSVARTPQ